MSDRMEDAKARLKRMIFTRGLHERCVSGEFCPLSMPRKRVYYLAPLSLSTRIIAVCPAACGPRTTCGVITITSVA